MNLRIPKKFLLVFCAVLFVSFVAWIISLGLDPKNQEYDSIKMKETDTITANVIASPLTTRFAQALDETTYASILSGNTPYTVFVPQDESFVNLPDDTSEAIFGLADTAIANAVVSYHIVPGFYKFGDLRDGMKLKTVEGEELTFKKNDRSLLINGYSYVTTDDVFVKNGVIHMVDNYLIPPSLTK